MSKYKLLLLDLDGTTVASKGNALPSPKVKEAVNRAKAELNIAIVSGRPFPLAKPVVDDLQLTGLGVFNGGAEIVNMQTGEIKSSKLLPASVMRELFLVSHPFGYNVYSDEDQYSTPVKRPEQIKKDAAKFFIEEVSTRDLVAMLEELASVKQAAAHPTSSWGDGDVMDIHVTHEHGTKKYGVERLIKLLKVSKGEVIAIGDSHNDLPLLEAAGLRIAMGNAPSEIKHIADFVTATLDDDGVAVAIEKFILKDQDQ
jgi:Cof subfamily protein (haloacid dehalogenase superfamily)